MTRSNSDSYSYAEKFNTDAKFNDLLCESGDFLPQPMVSEDQSVSYSTKDCSSSAGPGCNAGGDDSESVLGSKLLESISLEILPSAGRNSLLIGSNASTS